MFGVALASGFLKGINQNINFEKARRLKEDETIEGFQAQLNKAVLESDGTNTAGINAISKQLASARKQQKNRLPVDMFGRAGKKIDMGIVNTANLINKTLQSPIPMGDYVLTDNVLKKYNEPSASAEDKANMFFTALEKNLMTTPKLRAKTLRGMAQNRHTFNAVKKQWKKHVNWMIVARSGAMENAKNGGSAVIKYDPRLIPTWDIMTNLLKLSPTFEFDAMSQLAMKKSEGEYNNSNSLLLRINTPDGKAITQYKPIKEFVENAGYDSQFKDPTKFKEVLNGIAAIHGDRYRTGAEWLYSHNSKTTPFLKGEDVQNKFYQDLNHTMELYTLNAHKPRSSADNIAIGKYFMDNNITDPYHQARILQPLIKRENLTLSNIYEDHGVTVAGSKTKKDWWQENYGTTLKDARLASQAVDSGLNDLYRLRRIVQELPQASGTLIDKAASLYFSFVGEGSQGEQIGNLLRSTDGVGGSYYNKGGIVTDSNSLRGIIERDLANRESKGIFGASIRGKMSAADVLRYTIAAKLARAEDPAGRLSNQDFERQLIKLGSTGMFGSKEAELKQLDEVIREFENKKKNFVAIKGIMDSGNNYFTSDERSFLTANLIATNSMTEFESDIYRGGGYAPKRNVTSEEFQKLVAPEGGVESTIMPSGYSVTSTGTPVYQDKSAPEDGVKQYYIPQPNGTYMKVPRKIMSNYVGNNTVTLSVNPTGNPTGNVTGSGTSGGGTGGGGTGGKLAYPSNITSMTFVAQTGGVYTTPNHPGKTFKLINNQYVEQ